MRTAGSPCMTVSRGLPRARQNSRPAAVCDTAAAPTTIRWLSAALFIRFLREQGVLPPPATPASPADRWPLIREFRSWMRQHRGLTETTLDVYQPIIAELLTALGSDPRLYTAEALRGFALERARRHGIWRAKTVVVSVRAFLRFLGATGQCPPGHATRHPRFRLLAALDRSRFLAAEDVERMIQSCGDDGAGSRDKPVLLLLARLGLRASEVAQLRFADIDWRNGGIAVCGKGRRQRRCHSLRRLATRFCSI